MCKYKLSGMILPFNEKSSITNNIYTKECIQTAFDNYAEQLKDNDIIVDLSHKITSLNLKDDGIYADIELLDTEQGNNFKQLIDNGKQYTLPTTALCRHSCVADPTEASVSALVCRARLRG